MRITTKITWDMSSGEVLEHEFYEYSGEVAELKESKAAKEARKRQALMDAASKESLARLNSILDPLNAEFMNRYIKNTQGYTTEQIAALNADAIDTTGRAYRDAGGAVAARALERSGGQPVGGDFVRDIGGFEEAHAGERAGALRKIQLNNAELALRNKFAAAGVIGNVAGIQAGVHAGDQNAALNAFAQRMNQLGKPSLGQTALAAGIGAGATAVNNRLNNGFWG